MNGDDDESLMKERSAEIVVLRAIHDFLQACIRVEESYNEIAPPIRYISLFEKEAYKILATSLSSLFPGCAGGLFMANYSSNFVEMVAEWGNFARISTWLRTDECWGLRRGCVHFVEQQHPDLFCEHIRGTGKERVDITSTNKLPTESLCVPIIARGETWGLLYLSAQKPGILTEAKQQLAQIISEHIRLALENFQLRGIIASQLIRDPHTGLFNRRYMEEYLARALKICDRKGQPLSIIMLDLDRFKHFHDTFGHSASDGVLQELGMFLEQNIRNFDIACRYGSEDEFTLILPEGSVYDTTDRLIAGRYGGDEFMLILPEVSLYITEQLAEQLREKIKHLRLQHYGHQVSSVTVSVGVACFPEHGLTGDVAISAARAALDRAKEEGRDRVVTASDN